MRLKDEIARVRKQVERVEDMKWPDDLPLDDQDDAAEAKAWAKLLKIKQVGE